MRSWLQFGGVLGVLSALVAPLVGGCSSAVNPYPDVNSFCQGEAAAYCQQGGVVGVCDVSVTACETAQQAACNTAATQATASGTRAYNSANAQACIDAVTTAFAGNGTAAFAVSYPTLQQLAVTCDDDVFPGSVPRNGSCKTTDDCAQGSTPANGSTPGIVCSPVEPGSSTMECALSISVSTGVPCANFGSVCTDPGTYCMGVPAECQPGVEVGAACTAAKGCASDGFCQINAGATTGKCETPGTQGSECTGDENCSAVELNGAPAAPYCDLNRPVKSGSTGTGSCQQGLAFAGGPDCNAFGL